MSVSLGCTCRTFACLFLMSWSSQPVVSLPEACYKLPPNNNNSIVNNRDTDNNNNSDAENNGDYAGRIIREQ